MCKYKIWLLILYLSIKSVALCTLGEPSDNVLKAVHGCLYLWRVVSSICLSVLKEKDTKETQQLIMLWAAGPIQIKIQFIYQIDPIIFYWLLTRAKHFCAWARAESGLRRMHSSKSPTASSTWSNRIFSWKETKSKLMTRHHNVCPTLSSTDSQAIIKLMLKKPIQPHSYLTPVVIDIRVACVNLGCHVEILCREHRLLLLHVHASTLDQSIGS